MMPEDHAGDILPTRMTKVKLLENLEIDLHQATIAYWLGTAAPEENL